MEALGTCPRATVQSAKKNAMIGAAMKSWLCKQEIAHKTKFYDLLDLAKSNRATYLNDPQKF